MITPVAPVVIVVAGATGVGKTATAVELARLLQTEIINADSMQVYRHLSIGTAKPTAAELGDIRCHGIDVAEPSHQFNLGDFLALAQPRVEDALAVGRCPIVCGGTGMYIKGLLHGVFEDFDRDPQIRAALDAMDTPVLYAELQECDPSAAQKIMPNDRVRIIRALEVFRATGRRISDLHTHANAPPRWPVKYFVLNRGRKILCERIDQRVDQMVRDGLIDEVRAYLAAGYTRENPAVRALGYSEIIDALNGDITLESALETMKLKSRQYAKRQLTWLRGVPYAQWLDIDDDADAAVTAARIMDTLNSA